MKPPITGPGIIVAGAAHASGSDALVAAASDDADAALDPTLASEDPSNGEPHSESGASRSFPIDSNGSSGSDGGSIPPQSEDGFKLIREGLSHVDAASQLIARGTDAIQYRMAELEDLVASLRATQGKAATPSKPDTSQRLERLLDRVQNLEAKNRGLQRKNDELERVAEEGRGAIRDAQRAKTNETRIAAELERINDELEELRSATSAAGNLITGILSMLEGAAGNVEGALETADKIGSALGQDPETLEKHREVIGIIEGVAAILESIHTESESAERILSTAMTSRRSSVPAALVSEAIGYQRSVELSLDEEWLPDMDESVLARLPGTSKLILKKIFLSMAWAYEDEGEIEVGMIAGALLEAIRLASEKDAAALNRAVEKAISVIISPHSGRKEIRGFVHEAVRLMQLSKSGRDLSKRATSIPYMQFSGWRYNDQEGRFVRRKLYSSGEIDAKEGKTLIEIKGMWLGGVLGKFITMMLTADESVLSIPVEYYHTSGPTNGFDPFEHAIKIVNQLARYKKMISSGIGDKLELHVTSRDPVPNEVVMAMHTFLGKDKLEVIWYDHILTQEGEALSRQLSLDIGTQPEEEGSIEEGPASDEEISEGAIDGLPEPFEDETEDTPQATVIEDAGDDVELQINLEIDPDLEEETFDETGEVEDADDEEILKQLKREDDIRAAQLIIYPSKALLEHVEHNTSIFDDFIEWLVDNGHHEGLENLGDSEITRLYDKFVEEADAAQQSQTSHPWDSIEDKKAQNTFNGLMRHTIKKDIVIDWSKRVTKGVQNVDIYKTLDWLEDNSRAVDDALKQDIGNFKGDLKSRLTDGAYFKTFEDGPALLGLIKHHIWLRDKKPRSSSP